MKQKVLPHLIGPAWEHLQAVLLEQLSLSGKVA